MILPCLCQMSPKSKISVASTKVFVSISKVSRSPTVERLGEELVKAQQSVEVAEALAGSHQKSYFSFESPHR